jgi:pimeloyl-ACP methyl ester carboxylesterase
LLVEKSFDTGEVLLNYVKGSPNGPSLLLIHGITSDWRTFLPLMPFLTMRYHVYAIDLRGHGKSGRIPGHYTLLDYEKDVKIFIDEVIKEPTILFGHSLGGIIATIHAADNSNIAALIIGDSPPNYDNRLSNDTKVRMSHWLQAKKSASEYKTFDKILRSLKEEKIMWGDVPVEDPLILRNKAINWSRMDPDILTKMTEGKEGIREMWAGYDTARLFPKIQCPVLLLRGNPKLGGVIKDEEVEKAHNLIPDLTYVYYNEVGHSLFQFGAEPVLSKVSIFLESLR